MRKACLVVAAALSWAVDAHAQGARVDAVQYPAWLERGGHAVPLVPGTALAAGDRLRTGANARVALHIDGAGEIRLGERAEFVLERLPAASGAVLSLVTGAMRLVDRAHGRPRGISVRVGNTTADVGGAGLWGRSSPDREVVCLIEGRASVASRGHSAVVLRRPLDCHERFHGAAPRVVPVDAARFEQWVSESDLAADGAVARRDGRWRVEAAVFPHRDRALALSRSLRGEGYPATVGKDDGDFTVQVPGLAGETAARALMADLRRFPGVHLPRVQRAR